MNKLIFLILISVVFSCGTGKKVTGDPKSEDVRESSRVVKLDTVEWTIEESPEPPAITSVPAEIELPAEPGLLKMHVILPLGGPDLVGENGEDLDGFEEQLLHYYLGLRLWMKELTNARDDVSFVIHDSKQKDLDRILQEVVANDANMIFGGRGNTEVSAIAEVAREYKIPYISPWLTRSPGEVPNPYYIQLNPGLDAYLEAIINDALSKYAPEQLTIVSSQAEIDRVDRMKELWETKYMLQAPFETLILNDISDIEEISFYDIRKPEDIRVFILTATSDVLFIHDFLRQINIHEYRDSSVVYGLTLWDSEILSEYKNLFDLTLASPDFPKFSTNWNAFAELFYSEYYTLPLLKAVEGYNHMKVSWELYRSHYRQLAKKLPEIPLMDAINTRYRFSRLPDVKLDAPKQKSGPGNLENRHIYLLNVEDYQYKLSE
jgi:hypothetical protein